jgi:NADH-quinone oxidoreductase subunit L
MLDYAWLIPLFPLVGVLIGALPGRWLGRRLVAGLACSAVIASFVAAAIVLVEMLGLPAADRSRTVPLLSWIGSGTFRVELNLLLDPLSILMALVVSGVSALIHVYSAAYMKGEFYYKRYFTWLNLFVLMMLALVLSDNFVVLYLGWEGVGLCSYLLIGYWFERETAADAAKKAFLVNRVGDFGLALGIMLIFATFGSVAFADVLPAAPVALSTLPAMATAIALLLFLGAVGKSAQIPLHVWLPDAMEGPTPVSALIHAATMVTAGVYLVARSHALFEASGPALNWVIWIGVLTAFFAATVALVQKDLKRVLAYSTISQLGYMFLGLGAGAYGAAIFHLATHAFFKALLFLGAGSVMHALSGELDIFKMGGLRKKLPWTFATFLVGVLALTGVPLFSGFFSKEAILGGAFEHGALFPWLLGLVTAGLTAAYGFRLLFVVFYGKSRLDKKVERQVHESPAVMVVPMLGLAALAAVGGYLGLPRVLGLGSAVGEFLAPAFAGPVLPAAELSGAEASAVTEWLLIALSIVAVAVGFGVAYWLYVRRWGRAESMARSIPWLYDLLYEGYRLDWAYTEAVVKPLRALGDWLAGPFEERGIDGAVDGLARLLGLAGQGLRRLQTGLVRSYALAMLFGAVAIVAFFLIRVFF